MKNFKPIGTFACAAAVICVSGLASCVSPAGPKSATPPANATPAATNSVAANQTAAGQPAPKPKKRLSGAELYSMHCNRCHPERYPTERTAAQWKTIMLHMEVRANLPEDQARLILKYLQENSGR